jgi:hypothetical protein
MRQACLSVISKGRRLREKAIFLSQVVEVACFVLD